MEDKSIQKYRKQLEEWKKREPIGGSNYDYESWLEEKPMPPGKQQ